MKERRKGKWVGGPNFKGGPHMSHQIRPKSKYLKLSTPNKVKLHNSCIVKSGTGHYTTSFMNPASNNLSIFASMIATRSGAKCLFFGSPVL